MATALACRELMGGGGVRGLDERHGREPWMSWKESQEMGVREVEVTLRRKWHGWRSNRAGPFKSLKKLICTLAR